MSQPLAQSPGLEVHVLDDGYAVYDGSQKRLHHLNIAAAIVFELCDGSTDAERVVRTAIDWLPGLTHDTVHGCVEELQRASLVCR